MKSNYKKFDDVPPAGRYRHWSDYLLPDEREVDSKDMMRLAIDRYYLQWSTPGPI